MWPKNSYQSTSDRSRYREPIEGEPPSPAPLCHWTERAEWSDPFGAAAGERDTISCDSDLKRCAHQEFALLQPKIKTKTEIPIVFFFVFFNVATKIGGLNASIIYK